MQDYLEELLEMSLLLAPEEYGDVVSEDCDMTNDVDECASV